MKNSKTKCVVFLLILSMTVTAADTYFANSSEPRAKLDLSPNKKVHKLFPLTLQSVNDGNIIRRNDVVWLKPGDYTLVFQTHVDQSFIVGRNMRSFNDKINNRNRNRMEITVEAGKDYQLAYDARPTKMENWKPIVLNVKDH